MNREAIAIGAVIFFVLAALFTLVALGVILTHQCKLELAGLYSATEIMAICK